MGIKEIEDTLKELTQSTKDEKKMKEKRFKYPFGKKVGKGQKKKNYITMIAIGENKTIDFKKYQIIDQSIMHEMIPRLATADCVLLDRKANPVIIQPSWSVEPFSPSKHFEESIEEGNNINGYKILMAKMESEKTNVKPKMGGAWKWIIGLGLAGLVIYAIMSGGGA